MTTTAAPTALTAAAHDGAADTRAARQPDQATYLIVSVVVTSLLFLVGIGGGLLLLSGEVPMALGVGLFTAFWGGPGFGLMAGFALYNLRTERA